MKKISSILLVGIFIAVSCGEIFEKNIENKTVEVISPAHGVAVAEGETTFLWREVVSATHYHITIVSPDFATSSRVVVDTIMPDTVLKRFAFTHRLDPGNYQWNIRAWNFAYRTRENILALEVIARDNDAGSGDDD
ncbi:MAG: hypothetical protein LIO77_07885 [Rikenellaceae bacterium]|nr:hypothetical protein [Rikenellaceae bacterium]